jgi:para-nitrobenzyl esterase
MNFASIDPAFEDTGYLGIKDQIAALQWVKENIAEFGGNPDNITIFGESAGSTSCSLLTVTPAAKGLFDKAILQSGNSSLYTAPEISAEVAKDFMKLSGAKNMNDLMKKSSDELKNIYAEFAEARSIRLMDFIPTCDGKFIPSEPFMAYKDGAAREIKILLGTTADEWRAFLLADEKLFDIFRENPQGNSAILSRYKKRTAEEIYKKWLNNRPDTSDTYGDFLTQLDWRVAQELAAEYHSKFNDAYFYLFSEQSPIEGLGSCHGLDVAFTFSNPDDALCPNPDKKFANVIQKTWTAFATNGNPDNEFIPHWEKYSADNRQTMELNSKGCSCQKDLNTQNLNALRYVYES